MAPTPHEAVPRWSLKRSLTLAMLALALFPLLVAGGLTVGFAFVNERDSQALSAARRSTRIATDVTAHLALLDRDLESLRRFRELSKVAPAERADMFAILMSREPAIVEIVLLDAQHRPLTHVSSRTPTPTLAWLKPADLDAAASAGETTMGAIDVDPATGEPEFALVQPLVGLRSGTAEGHLVARCRMTQVWESVERVARGTDDEALIVDNDGRVIAHRDPSVVLRGSHFDPPARSGIGRAPSGRWAVMGVEDLRVLGRTLRIVDAIPLATAFSGSLRLLLMFCAISVATLAAALLLALYLRRRILRPVDGLTEAARRLQAGDWSTSVAVPREDELGQLAVTFNEMTSQLRDNQQQLEQRIAERTAELANARDAAERASRSKSEFLSSMSHELRTPMNAILGFGQLLGSETAPALPPRQQGFVKEILRAGSHLLDLINEVLDLARVEAGKLQISLEPVNVKALLDDCLALVAPVAAEHRVRVVDAAPASCDCHVLADRTRARQVLLNLLSNAIKYNREGGSVRVDCTLDHGTVRIGVADTGPGLSPQQQRRLFQGFERLDADKGAIEGAGIGLALSKRLVELMRGEIGVESVVGEGSTFWVRLARAEAAPPAPAPATAAPTAAPAAAPAAGRTYTVLYIEDNEVNVMLMEALLAQHPHLRLLTAPLPGLGLDMARAHRPDVILLDIQLPGMDGYEVLRRLRSAEATRSIPVIALSANAMARDIERGMAAGFAAYQTKPLDVARMIAEIHRALAAAAVRD